MSARSGTETRQRERQIGVRVTDGEFATITAAAAARGVKPGEYLRNLAAPPPGGLVCDGGCGLAYDDPGWCDVLIPTDVWVRISPRGDAGGVMCMNCTARALVALGLDDVPMVVTSGPWAFRDPNRTIATPLPLAPYPDHPSHNHVTRDIKPPGQCPGCDAYHDRERTRR